MTSLSDDQIETLDAFHYRSDWQPEDLHAAVELMLAEQSLAFAAKVEKWAALLEGESPVGCFIAAEARTRLLNDDDASALAAVKAQTERDTLLAYADHIDASTVWSPGKEGVPYPTAKSIAEQMRDAARAPGRSTS